MLILGIHSGYHDACAALFDEYRMVSAGALERLTRRKIDGGRVPTEAFAECLAIAGRAAREVDAVVLGRAAFPSRYCAPSSRAASREQGARHARQGEAQEHGAGVRAVPPRGLGADVRPCDLQLVKNLIR